jgi:hypothetical protein
MTETPTASKEKPMSIIETETMTAAPPRPANMRLRATDVTGSLEVEAEVPPTVSAGEVTEALVQRLELPPGPWALRTDRGAFLDDRRQIGEQVAADARVTLTPKTHLG